MGKKQTAMSIRNVTHVSVMSVHKSILKDFARQISHQTNIILYRVNEEERGIITVTLIL